MHKRLAISLSAALIFGWQVSATPEGAAKLVSAVKWEQPDDWFGGFSGIEVSADGSGFTAVTDSGTLVTGAFERDAGIIQSVETLTNEPVQDRQGLITHDYDRDAEGLAIRPDGQLFISFEGRHQVFSYGEEGGRGTELDRHADFHRLERNGSLEALAIDETDRLYTLAETSVSGADGLPVYRFEQGQWTHAFTLPERVGFKPVGADFGPDGLFYLLERKFNGFGFRTSVRRFDVTEDVVSNEETLILTSTGTHDNLEGLAVWEDPQGQTRLTMISDDNFIFYQRTEIVEYQLPAPAF